MLRSHLLLALALIVLVGQSQIATPQQIQTNTRHGYPNSPADKLPLKKMAHASSKTNNGNDVEGYRQQLEDAWSWLISDINRVVAIGTIIIAGTAVLQLRAARKSNERQLRAYVSITPKSISNFGSQKIVQIHCTTKNHGLTPATRINHSFQIDVIPALPIPFEPPEPTRAVIQNTALFPGDEMKSWFNHDRVLTQEEVTDIENGTSQLHIWGITTYRDAFGGRRHTEFNASVGGDAFAQSVRAARSGNKNPPEFAWAFGNNHGRNN